MFFTRRRIAVLLGTILDAVQLTPPEAFECAGPFMKRPDRFGIGSIEHLAALAANVNQADVAQYPKMFRDRRLLQAQDLDDIAHGAFLRCKIT